MEMDWPSGSTPTRHDGQVVGVDPSLNLPALNVRLHSSHSTNVSRGRELTPAFYSVSRGDRRAGVRVAGHRWRRRRHDPDPDGALVEVDRHEPYSSTMDDALRS